MSDLLFATFVNVLTKLAPIGYNKICSHTKAHLPLLQLHLKIYLPYPWLCAHWFSPRAGK